VCLRSSQLNGQGNAVKLDANVGHCARVQLCEREVRLYRACSLHEQPHRFDSWHRLQRRHLLQIRQTQRGHTPHGLTRQGHRLTAGCQDPELRAPLQKLLNQLRAVLDHLFAVIQDEQDVSRAQPFENCFPQTPAGLLLEPQCRRNRLDHQSGVQQR